MLQTRRPDSVTLLRNSPLVKDTTLIPPVPSAGLNLVMVVSLMTSLQSLLIFQTQNFLKDLTFEIQLDYR